jgi:gliding motility associated protien GldN
MKFINRFSLVFALVAFFVAPSFAQLPEEVQTEASEPTAPATPNGVDANAPLDDIVEREIIKEKRTLPHQPIREADIFWEKKIWRIIDIREKMNLPFSYPEMPFFKIVYDAALKGQISAFSVENDKFTNRFDTSEIATIGTSTDTVVNINPETYEEQIKIVRNDLNPEDVKRFRLKEVWFFDEQTSTMQVRILGIAPLMDVKDDNGNFRYEQPMFWLYYPEVRKVLAQHKVFNPNNDAFPMSWEDYMEMRYFSSYIFKESNVYDRRLEAYLTGVDLLIESEKIKADLFNFEHDLWSY